MKEKIRLLFMNILYYFPHKIAHKIFYKRVMEKKLNLKNPLDLNEKIQWLILYKYGQKEALLADKYLVKNELIKLGYEKYIPKLYGVYNNFNEIDFNKLPNKFVLKTNNGCGNIFVCKNKKTFDIEHANKVLNKALKNNFAKFNLEYHYSYIEPKIICEEFLDDGSDSLPTDYKFYCFNGKCVCILVCTERVDENNKKIAYYNTNWQELDYLKTEYKTSKKINKPKNLEEMVKLASDLSKGHDFVRVDLYNLNGKIYFGELTFTPACGMIQSLNQEALNYLGSFINLEGMKQ